MRQAPAALSLVFVFVVGCASGDRKSGEPEPVVISTILEFDPTESYELPLWWTNGEALLHLQENGAYALYEGMNRYRAPAQRGRWNQHSYAALWLEPYAELESRRIRASIRRIGGAFVLEVPGHERMMALDGPPPVLEDRLLGHWTAGFGTLRLDPDLRYVYSTAPAGEGEPAELAGHEGTWQVEQETLLLQPSSPGLPPIRVRIEEGEETIVLETADGRLTRPAPDEDG